MIDDFMAPLPCSLCDKPPAECRCREDAEIEWEASRPRMWHGLYNALAAEVALGLLGYALYQLFR
jgi:hypothetical protein